MDLQNGRKLTLLGAQFERALAHNAVVLQGVYASILINTPLSGSAVKVSYKSSHSSLGNISNTELAALGFDSLWDCAVWARSIYPTLDVWHDFITVVVFK